MAQIIALVIFVAMFVLIVTDKIERHYVTLGCGLLTLILVFGVCMRDPAAIMNTLNVKPIFTLDFWYAPHAEGEESGGINWATIIFIAGMMIMVEGMARAGFFRWLCMKLAKLVHYKTIPVFVTFMLMSFVLAMFIDSITVILFLASVTIELSRLLKFDPVPMILSEVFCANLGGSATMCGDPPNIIIGTSLGYSFFDFILNTGAMAVIALVFTLIYFYLVFRKQYSTPSENIDISALPSPESCITDKKGFALSTVIFLIAVVMLVTHSMTHLTVAFIGVFVSLATVLANTRHLGYIMKRVDYKTLLFFIGLFVVVGGLEQTGVLETVAGFIGKISGGNSKLMIAIIIWGSAVASAFIDNIPFAATMIPVIKTLAVSSGVPLDTLAWALSMGTDIGGSGTPIGASANVVGTSAAAKAGHPIGWGEYCSKAAPATVIVLAVCTAYIFVVYL
ncbi:MAG: ArsB/NhaD family transporter [Oscillospiraceae bacterium]|nr:ArsB/NhaD family transporter [Oscillospiraceae bacterium]